MGQLGGQSQGIHVRRAFATLISIWTQVSPTSGNRAVSVPLTLALPVRIRSEYSAHVHDRRGSQPGVRLEHLIDVVGLSP